MTDSFILVGVDAFPPSRNALCWAVDEALRRNMPLQIVTVIRPRAETEEAEARRRASDAQRHAIDAALRERITALGGSLSIADAHRGVRVAATIPLAA